MQTAQLAAALSAEVVVGQGSQYAAAFVDAQGDPLDGSKTYKVHMPPNIPAKDFWSFTLYDNQTRSMLQTDQQFPAVGSLTKGLLVNADGSVLGNGLGARECSTVAAPDNGTMSAYSCDRGHAQSAPATFCPSIDGGICNCPPREYMSWRLI